MSENMKLWNAVSETDPAHTKQANVKGNRITSINPQHQIKMATIEWGSYGKTWGFKEIKLGYELMDFGLVTFYGLFYYPDGEFPIINTIGIYKDNAKTKLDDDFAKKVETDALTKALSKLGFSADIFMGKYDDSRYVSEVTEKFAAKKALENPAVSEILEKVNANDQQWIQNNWASSIVPNWAVIPAAIQSKLNGK